VVHGKKTIIDKLNGSYEQKFAQARLLYLYMMTHPGKKLNFMGNELAMVREWDERREPDWDLLNMPAHDSFHRYIGELNRLYLKRKAIWSLDHTYDGFKWVDCKSDNKCVFGYTRTDGKQTLLALFNFSDKEAECDFKVDGNVRLILNTDWEPFGGNTKRLMRKSIPDAIPAFCGMLFSLHK
jgi:1,4-alpha-glucan branching enzyme